MEYGKGPTPRVWILVALTGLLSGLGVGITYYHARHISAVWPLLAGGSSVFLIFAVLCFMALWPISRMVYLGASSFGLGVMAVGFGIMYAY
jgi:hypothetical protein